MLFKSAFAAALLAVAAEASRKYAYCDMKWNLRMPSTYPYGMMKMYQRYVDRPIKIWGWMKQLPAGRDNSSHGFSFNWELYTRRVGSPFDGVNCDSTDTIFNPYYEEHGEMNGSPSMVGDLTPIYDDDTGYALYGNEYEYAERPTLFEG